MPGIAGIVERDGRMDLDMLLSSMLSMMQHEPWYKLTKFCQAPVALGKASPGIIDTDLQPVFSSDRSLCLVMYGEVYDYPGNFLESSEKKGHAETLSPAAVVLRLIEKKGTGVIGYLNGSFVLSLWNFGKKRLTIANDRFGLRPLYYFWAGNLFLFASEMKSILTCPKVQRDVDLEGVAQFMSFNFILGDRTLFKRIKILPPASFLTFEDENLNIETYWNVNFRENSKNYVKKDALDEAHFLVKQAVQRQVGDDIPKTLSLSGGLDSRTILGAAAQLQQKIPTFTFGIPECPDQKIAKACADSLEMENRFFELSPDFLIKWAKRGVWLTEGMNNCVNFHGIEFTPEIKRNASIVLNGFMGGELFGCLSFSAFKLLFKKSSGDWIKALFHQMNYPFPICEHKQLFQSEIYSQTEGSTFESFRKTMQNSPAGSPFDRFQYFRLREQDPKLFFYGLLLDNNLIEYRVPFCDYDLVDMAVTLPSQERALAIFHRRLLTKKFPPLGSIPYQRTGLPVNSGITRIILTKTAERLKRKVFTTGKDQLRYVDYDQWMRNQLKAFLVSILLSDRFLGRGYFNPAYIKQIVEQHLSGKQDFSSGLGALLTFEIWNRLFIDKLGKP